MKIKKYQLIKILEILKEHYKCKTLEEAINLLNEEISNDTDIAFTFKIERGRK